MRERHRWTGRDERKRETGNLLFLSTDPRMVHSTAQSSGARFGRTAAFKICIFKTNMLNIQTLMTHASITHKATTFRFLFNLIYI